MNARPLPFISSMYFLLAISPETLTAVRPAFAAVSTKRTTHFSLVTVAQTNPVRNITGSHSQGRSINSSLYRHEDVLSLPGQYFLFPPAAQLGKLSLRRLRFAGTPLASVNLRHLVIGQGISRVELHRALEIGQRRAEISLVHRDLAAEKVRRSEARIGGEGAVHCLLGLRTQLR